MKFYLFLVGVSAAGLVESSVFGISCLVRLASSVATSFWISSWSSFSRTTRFFKMSFFNCSFWRYNFLYCINHNHHTISIIKQQTQTKWKEKENPINKIPNSFFFLSLSIFLSSRERKKKGNQKSHCRLPVVFVQPFSCFRVLLRPIVDYWSLYLVSLTVMVSQTLQAS